jgi:phosphatidylserine/phosphatidylglycerophosphate/cardiolipin synthase-like enzyme
MAKVKLVTIDVFANNDDAMVVWRYPFAIKNCLGFALKRMRKGQTNPEIVNTSVGFEGEKPTTATNPSTVWPIQRYNWMDYYVRTSDEVSYQAVPMIHMIDGTLKEDTKNATPWSKWTKIGNQGNVEVYFNRGIVSSQSIAKQLAVPQKEMTKKLKKLLLDPTSKVRNYLGGTLAFALNTLLKEVKENKNLKLYAALYELNEPELIKNVNAIGKRANVILANGAFNAQTDLDPEKEHAKQLNKITLTRRKVGNPHFAHNKFVVITDKSSGKEVPIKVWTGSTNWTTNGLFAQVNNAILINDKTVAAYYKESWNVIFNDCDGNGKGLYGKEFKDFNATVKESKDKKIKTFFTPVPKQIDLTEATKLIENAKYGILFLMFKPSNTMEADTLYKTIKEVSDKKGTLTMGVINGDPGGKENPTIKFYHKGKEQKGNFNSILPDSIKTKLDFWIEEMGRPTVTIHSKVIVLDAFSDNPIVMTGSHNLGSKASKSNDDNLNIISGNSGLAQAYGIHIMAVYHHYRWRFYRAKNATPKWNGNKKNDVWQEWFTKGFNLKELNFWTKK